MEGALVLHLVFDHVFRLNLVRRRCAACCALHFVYYNYNRVYYNLRLLRFRSVQDRALSFFLFLLSVFLSASRTCSMMSNLFWKERAQRVSVGRGGTWRRRSSGG